jgi:hypothetical protein
MKKQEIKSLTEEEIRTIADELNSGLQCYWNFTNNDLVFIPDPDRIEENYFSDENPWEEDLKKVKKNKKNFVLIECPNSHQSYRIMSDFADVLEDSNPLALLLRAALQERKPFSKFRFVIDNSGDYRERWFAFKTKWLMDFVREQIEMWRKGEN